VSLRLFTKVNPKYLNVATEIDEAVLVMISKFIVSVSDDACPGLGKCVASVFELSLELLIPVCTDSLNRRK
jgi:hypothetical protein